MQTEAAAKAWGRDAAFRQEVAIERLLKEGPAQRELPVSTDDQCRRLWRAPCTNALLEEILIMDHTTALMGPERAGTDQRGITPGQCLLKNPAVT